MRYSSVRPYSILSRAVITVITSTRCLRSCTRTAENGREHSRAQESTISPIYRLLGRCVLSVYALGVLWVCFLPVLQ